MSELNFSPGAAVEVSLDAEDSPDIWYPATVVKENRIGSFVVKYVRSDEAGSLTATVDRLRIRPSPPPCVNTTFQLLEKVDAFCNFGWSSGVVTKVLSEGRYIVYFKRTRKEKELRHTDLRLPMMQIHGKWVPSSQDAVMVSKPQENKDNILGDSGKSSLTPENSGAVKERKEARNGQQERALPSGKASSAPRCVSSMRIKGVSRNDPLYDRTFKELNTESAPKELQLSLKECETQIAPTEQLDKPELEVPICYVSESSCMEQSENGNQANAESVSLGLEISAKEFDSPTSKRSRLRGKTGRGRGRPRGSVSRNPRASMAEAAAKQKSTADMQKPIVISLPCYNTQWNKLQAQTTSKIPMHIVAEVEEKEKQIPHTVTDGSIVNNVNRGNPEVKESKNEDSAPKRKRGRPFGSFSAGKKRLIEAGGVSTIFGSTRRRSTRERREVYKSAIDTLKPRGKKLKTTVEILSSTQETQANQKENADGVITNNIEEYVEPVSREVSGNISDEDMPLSSWLELNPGGTASQSGQLEGKNDQISSFNKETTGGKDVNLAQSASQLDGTSMQRDKEKMMGVLVNGLPFCKTSPIWNVIESMEVFQQIPQNPHFQPLYGTKEHCREGLAICSMVTFSRVAENICKFQFDDPINILEDSMETLSDLERQGFRVELMRSRLNALLSIKREHEQSHSLAKEIAKEEKERATIDQELHDIDKKMAELRERRASTVVEREKKDFNIVGLHLRFDSVRDALEAARSEFERVASAPW